ncbi:hypothetical protein B5M44_20745 [Shinella sumterensis]|jgi:hypothetical protein|uniref:hypothetical protein n=1 Tax=Shinella sumterensis TaxID=1967501 RepID=UPI00110505BD|nr:hypothetical protein [Shinella sumterensis]TFE95798.1 hypothetical protein B5M44_20745 [Shinella sumterensis]
MSRFKDRRETMELARHRVQTDGVEAAVDALISVCRDPKAPAPAKSTAGTSLLRAAGFFDRDSSQQDKEPHEMTAAELRAQSAKLERARDAMLAQMEGGADDGNAFD